MRFHPIKLAVLAAVMVSACDFWPRDLGPLAESISHQVSGETTAWLVGGDVVVIDIVNSPLIRAAQLELESQATDIAEQTIEFTEAPLESIAITFYESGVTDDRRKDRDFIFLVMENRPVLQPYLDVDAAGPLTLDEIQAAIDRIGDTLTENQRECVLEEAQQRAQDAGDPETLDAASVDFLTAETWKELDTFGKRLILTGAITGEALFACAQRRSS